MLTREDISAAYRLLLGREADSQGMEHYLKWARDETIGRDELVDVFLSSTERVVRMKSRSEATPVEVNGAFVYVDPVEPEFGRHIAANKTWEPHISSIISERLSPGQVFVDVGANVGVMAFAAARTVGPSGKVIAFEPNPDNARNFLLGVIKNRFEAFVRLYPIALAAETRVLAIEGSSNTFLVDKPDSVRVVQCVPGDDLLRNEERINFIKIDIEGYEPWALKGLARTLKIHRPQVLCEFNPRCLREHVGQEPRQFAEQLFTLTARIEVVEYNGSMSSVTSPEDLVGLWIQKNRDAVESGMLPEGLLHFDLLFIIDKT
jgi:FkbM family methyltransferase